MATWRLDTKIKEIGPTLGLPVGGFLDAGVTTVGELLMWVPKRYEDRRIFTHFPVAPSDIPLCLKARLIDVRRRGGGGKSQYVQAVAMNSSDMALGGKVTCRWFNMPYLVKILAAGQHVILYGKVKEFKGILVMDHPEYEMIDDEIGSIHLDRVVPVYRKLGGVGTRALRQIIWRVLADLDQEGVKKEYNLNENYPRDQALRELHFPENLERADGAKRYFAAEEFFELQLQVAWRKRQHEALQGRVTAQKTSLLKTFYQRLPFDLTDAQKRSVREIFDDMKSGRPMNRLLQGDVGSGKTLVALCAALLAVEKGLQVALMAPTQILAEQHYLTFSEWLEPLGLRLALYTGERVEEGAGGQSSQIIIGTHALLFDKVKFAELGLVIVDEQHKFGVMQRGRLIERGVAPDVLVMTATPIPRTLTLTVYGDLDVSVLDQAPRGRGRVVTVVRKNPKPKLLNQFIRDQLQAGRQVYLIYPLVESADGIGADDDKGGLGAVNEFDYWQEQLKPFSVGLLHGKMGSLDKEKIMHSFRIGETKVLVATTVVEVGVDVPNANTMVIWQADRFGLAQLHQLRGRIGRGDHKSYCVLVSEQTGLNDNDKASSKLAIMEETSDGFKIAEADLRLRGPGELLGQLQSGAGTLKFVEFFADIELLKQTRSQVERLLNVDPRLENHPKLRGLVDRVAERNRVS